MGMSNMIRSIALGLALGLFGCWALPGGASAEETQGASVPPPAGLLWNRTGLPAVFPLQVKSPTGRDYLLTLIADDTGEEALAAYITGGAFFKVLVPPGAYRLHFAAGQVWHGEEDLFGPGDLTEVFELETPLTFEIRNPGIKAGHVVDLTGTAEGQMARARTTEQLVCQTVGRTYLRLPMEGEIGLQFQSPERQRFIWSWRGQLSFPFEHRADAPRPLLDLDYRYFSAHPTVRRRPCG